jgi:hypothetical protein
MFAPGERDGACKECGYQRHAPHCPTQRKPEPAIIPQPAPREIGYNNTPQSPQPAPFAVGDLVRHRKSGLVGRGHNSRLPSGGGR